MSDNKFGISITTKTAESSYEDILILIKGMEKLGLFKITNLIIRDTEPIREISERQIVLYGLKNDKE